MKKRSIVIALVLVLVLALTVPVIAATTSKEAILNYRDIKITLNGQTVTPKDANGNSVEPFIIDGTTYLPVRAVSDALGLDVAWDQTTSTVALSTPENEKSVYITRTGEKYHYDSTCNGGTYFEVPMQTAIDMGLTPCNKCVGNAGGDPQENIPTYTAYTEINDNQPFFQTMN